MRAVVGVSLGAGLALACLGVACLRPTQITLDLATDVECSAARTFHTTIYGAAPEALTSTDACDPAGAVHEIGTLVIAPSGAKDAPIVLSAVLGVSRPSEDCAAAGYKGCIVARRRLRFSPHDALRLPVRLDRSCLDIPCNDDQTCAVGRCVPADIDDPRFCDEATCPPLDAGVRDAGPVAVSAATPITQFEVRAVGLAEDPRGFWRTHANPGVSFVNFLSWDGVGSSEGDASFGLVGAQFFGVAASPTRVVVAVQNGANNLFITDQGSNVGVPTPGPTSDASAFGMAYMPGASGVAGEFVMSFADGHVRTVEAGTELTTTPDTLSTGFLEAEGVTVYWPSIGHITSVTRGATGFAAPVDAGALPASLTDPHGFALSPSTFYVGERSGRVVAIRRATGASYELLEAGSLVGLEDLLARSTPNADGTRDLYLAADAGVFRAFLTE